MYKLFIGFMMLFLLACSEEPKPSPDSPEKTTVAEQTSPMATEVTSTASVQQQSSLGPGLNLWVGSAETGQGTEICIDITTSKIRGLLSMQYSLRWDPEILEFISVKGFSIPTMDDNDFGSHKASEGSLTAVWIDDTLQGVNKEDGDVLYQLCFKAIGTSGDVAPVRFWSSPTPFEVVVMPENVIPLTSHKGTITIL